MPGEEELHLRGAPYLISRNNEICGKMEMKKQKSIYVALKLSGDMQCAKAKELCPFAEP